MNVTDSGLFGSSENLPFKFCSNHNFNNTGYSCIITIFTCATVALLSPVAVVGNGLVLAAIWKNPSLRTPSYILLGGLALTDFCTGLLGEPFYVLYRVAELVLDKRLYCVTNAVAHSIIPYLVVITGLTLTAMAVERWLLMSHRRVTLRRVYLTQGAFLLIPIPYMTLRRLPGMKPYFDVPVVPILEGSIGLCCFLISSLSYYKVFGIIRRHKRQVGSSSIANATSGINIMEKYKKSVYTILWILTLFLVSFSPYIFSTVVVEFLNVSRETSLAVLHVSTTVMLMSSSLNPFLYIWRLRELREDVKKLIKKVCRKL